MNELNTLSNKVIGLCIKIHTKLGPGLLESVYKECLFYELLKSEIFAEKEKPLPIVYEEIKLDYGYRIDILVDKILVLELKAVDTLIDVHFAQLLTYLRLGNYKLGLLINFNVMSLKDGIKRIIN